MYICIYICIYIYIIYVYMYIFVYMYIYVYMYVRPCVCVTVCARACNYVYIGGTHVHKCTCIDSHSVSIDTCTHICNSWRLLSHYC